MWKVGMREKRVEMLHERVGMGERKGGMKGWDE